MEKYHVLELIGEGSFGRVFRGRSKNNESDVVALKLMPKVSQSERELNCLRRECKIQLGLNHVNIVKAHDAFETLNELVLVTEFVENGNLASLMGKNPNGLPELQVRQITLDLLCALHYLHTMRVLHRDLKPQNVLLDSMGRAKLADFGFARNLGLNTFVLTSIKGTPLYMAPELIEERPYDHKADLWSAGGILYETAIGKPPFATNSLFQLIKKIRYEQIVWPPNLGKQCAHFLQGLLEKDSKKRLSWPQILSHPFVKNDGRMVECLGLNLTLTESQELAKEIQRQDKAKLLPGGSQTLIRVAQQYEEQKKRLESMKLRNQFAAPQPFQRNRRYSDISKPVPTYYDRQRRNSAPVTQKIDDDCEEKQNLLEFVDSQLTTLLELNNINHVCNPSCLNMLMKPLRSKKSQPGLVKKVVYLLSLPFVLQEEGHESVLRSYTDVKVLPNIVYAFKVNVLSPEFDSNEELLGASNQLLLLLNRLVHSSKEFVVAAYESIGALQVSQVFLKYLNCDKVQSTSKSCVLEVLNRILSDNLPDCRAIPRELFLEDSKKKLAPLLNTLCRDKLTFPKVFLLLGLWARIDNGARAIIASNVASLTSSNEPADQPGAQSAIQFCNKWCNKT